MMKFAIKQMLVIALFTLKTRIPFITKAILTQERNFMNWLAVKGYEGLYEVSDTGQVRSVTRECLHKNGNVIPKVGKVLAQCPNKNTRYMMCSLWRNNKAKYYYVHRLVAGAFIPNPDSLPEVNHMDGDRQNNHLSNLEWVTRKGNIRHAIDTGLLKFQNRYTEDTFVSMLQEVIQGTSYQSLTQKYDYKVPFLSTKLRKVAKKYGLEQELNQALLAQKVRRNKQAAPKQKRLRVAQYTLDGEHIATYDSLSEASRAIDIGSGAISNAVSGRTKTCGGFIWKSV